MRKIAKSIFVAMTFVVAVTHADKITEQMQAAIKAYEQKDYKGAMDELKFVTAQLQKLDAAENKKLLPPPLDGWKVEESKKSSGAMLSMLGGGGTMVQARYRKGDERVTIEIIANSPMIPMMSMAITNPALMASDPTLTPFRYKRNKGYKRKKGDRTEITLLIAGQILLKLTGKHLKDDKVLEQYLDQMDMQALKSNLL